MSAKERHTDKILKYLSNPDNEVLNREGIALKVLGFKVRQALYNVFSADELRDIERDALDLRRKAYALPLAAVDHGLLNQAAKGDPAAAKLCYQKFEGWSEKTIQEKTGKDGGPIEVEATVAGKLDIKALRDAIKRDQETR